jgi:hypothetical protein
MESKIKLLKELRDEEGHKINEIPDDAELLNKFYQFLISKKISRKKAFSIIYYLQEDLPVFSDEIEQCCVCKSIFDTGWEGLFWQSKGKYYCGACESIVPANYDRGTVENYLKIYSYYGKLC